MNILYSETVTTGANWWTFIAIVITSIGWFLLLSCLNKEPIILGFILGIIASIGLTWATGIAPWCGTSTYEKYTVTLDESVSVNDFLDKYEILERKGELYVVKEITTA